MYASWTLYPLSLAALNMGVGWLLFQYVDIVLGLGLLVLGILVLIALVFSTASGFLPALRTKV